MPSISKGSPERAAIQCVASSALQSKSVGIEKLHGYLFRTYRLRTSSGFFYILRCRPSNNVQLLRHEHDRLEVEATALQMISSKTDLSTARVIDYDNSTIAIGSQYLISGPYGGSILAEVEPSMSPQALASIDKSLGQYVRRLSAVAGPHFGPIRTAQDQIASRSWARAFAYMFETVLRDAEDSLISLPYDAIRDLVRKHRASLDEVTQPRLVLLDLVADQNVIVDTRRYEATGLLDFSTAIWGDPYLSDVFHKPTASFAEGFGKLPNGDAEERIRQYLYVLYHSLQAIVRQTCRPSDAEDGLEARRDLTTAMRTLATAPS